MRCSHWVALIGLVVGLGCIQVAQRNAVFLKGYAVGERMHHVHQQETDALWLNAQVTGLASPTHLSQVVQERRLKFVGWSTLHEADRSQGDPAYPLLVHMAVMKPSQETATRDETAD